MYGEADADRRDPRHSDARGLKPEPHSLYLISVLRSWQRNIANTAPAVICSHIGEYGPLPEFALRNAGMVGVAPTSWSGD